MSLFFAFVALDVPVLFGFERLLYLYFQGIFASTFFGEWLLGFISVFLFSAHQRFYLLRCTTFVLKLHTRRKSFLWGGNVTTRKVSLLG